MIPIDPRQHRAQYDDEGNIVLPFEEFNVMEESVEPQYTEVDVISQPSGEIILDSKTELSNKAEDQRTEIWTTVRTRMQSVTQGVLEETTSQFSWNLGSVSNAASENINTLKQSFQRLAVFMKQPVMVVRPKKDPKEYSRMKLFCLDVFRFGGTFAVLFLGLFVALNYQSFWQIASARLTPIEHAQAINQATNPLSEKLLKSPALAVAGEDETDLLSYLPPVGPPENRIVIPKLGLNVPLVIPPFDAVLNEDWQQVEEDIQHALQDGVVHYPGTARPGQAGNFFVTGHSSYYPWAPGKYKSVFSRLGELQAGDEYIVYYGGDKHRYIVRGKEEVKPTNVGVLDQPIDKRISTLMTCTPVGTTLRRLIVHAEEVDPETGIALEVGEHQKRTVQKAQPAMLPI